ncbi:Cytidylate kinase [Desulfonema limicola]|uniref:Cytidylate kinase n=1 Tax=Desulfonema limicola TaxID=45656 RepID=A0A975B738_9BACT|nr:(d)CMP kinase [Desulfonema limicola]QTA79775.1 Cytidylate kinase [Desulfonema limicola]
MKQLLITIDGPAGSGKTTVSRLLAEKLSYIYVDTGALYRGVALAVQKSGISSGSDDELGKLCKTLDLKFVQSKTKTCLILDGNDISHLIRTPEISMLASAISARPVVREYLLKIQRDMGKKKGTVFEGRDMGTIVFPDADFKFFLDACPEIRALRRYNELKDKNTQTLEEIEKDIRLRDKNDSTRKIAPLKPAEQAVIINSTSISAAQVVSQMMSFIEKK